MEFIKTIGQFEKMIDNKIIGVPNLLNSNINFRGKNNILVCNNIELNNVILEFNGDNSVVFINSNLKNFNLEIYSNSSFFLGKDNEINEYVKFKVGESQNMIIGDDCVIQENIFITTCDENPIYNSLTKERLNYSNSVCIGDHVFLGRYSYIENGCQIGSGAMINPNSYMLPNTIIPSNVQIFGNPAKIIQKDIFFIKDNLAKFNYEDSISSKDYKSNVFIFEYKSRETLSFKNIDKILKDLDSNSRVDFMQKLFIENKLKNRFSIL